MIFYTLLYLIILGFLAFDFVKISLGVKKVLLLLIMCLFTLIVSVSNDIGIDIAEYKNIYLDSPLIYDFVFGSYYKESGFIWINSIVKTYFESFNTLIFLVTTFNFFLLYKVLINKYFSKFMFFAFYLYITGYMYVGMFNQLRQHIIMSIFLFSILMLISNKKVNYLVVNLFGMLFHKASALYLLLVFVFKKQFSKRTYVLIFVLSFLIGITGMFFVILFNMLNVVSTPELHIVLLKIKSYYLAQLNSSVVNLAFFEKTLLFGMFLFYYHKITEINPINYILINIFFLNIFIYMLLIQDLQLAGRISRLLKIVEIVLIPQLFLIKIKDSIKKILFLFFVFLGFAHYYKELFRNIEYFIPYRTIF
jgi:hypothetical protein